MGRFDTDVDAGNDLVFGPRFHHDVVPLAPNS